MPELRDFLKSISNTEDLQTSILIFADWLEDQSDKRESKVRGWADKGDDARAYIIEEFPEALPDKLAGYDWHQAFCYAGKEIGYNTGKPERALPNDSDLSVDPFGRIDVKRVIAFDEGVHDEIDWLIVGELFDGRFFCLSASCDYTGWD